jgi:hypothetical protein
MYERDLSATNTIPVEDGLKTSILWYRERDGCPVLTQEGVHFRSPLKKPPDPSMMDAEV